MLCTYSILFFFKQKTAYELRISNWSSDVCSSELAESEQSQGEGSPDGGSHHRVRSRLEASRPSRGAQGPELRGPARGEARPDREIGRASCRERVCQYV